MSTTGMRAQIIEFQSLEVLHAQIEKYRQAGFFSDSNSPLSANEQAASIFEALKRKILKPSVRMLSIYRPLVAVLPKKIVSGKKQMDRISKTRGDQVEFNQKNGTIFVKTPEEETMIQGVDFSSLNRMVGPNQSITPYIINGPINLRELRKRIREFSLVDVLAIVFHCTKKMG